MKIRTLSALALLVASSAASALPSQARIVYEVLWGDHRVKVGRAEQRWQVADGRYELVTELKPLVGPRVRYVSSGLITAAGLLPTAFAEFRNKDAAPRARAQFDWRANRVRFGTADTPRTSALEAGAQDVNAFMFQLGWLGARAAGPMQIATGKSIGTHRFGTAAPVSVSVNGKRAAATPWSAADNETRTEVWLAPAYDNLPVRVYRNDGGDQIELIARDVQFTP